MKLSYDFEKGRAKLFKSGYLQKQVESINAIVAEANNQGIVLKNQLAYILATAYHESYNPRNPKERIVPINEFGGLTYLKGKKYYPYFGRGFVQLTWFANYKKYQPLIKNKFGVDIIDNPDELLRIDISAFVAVHGMKNGWFTGKKLSDYITVNKDDFVGARRIINGTDKASLISSYALLFADCVKVYT